MWSITGSMKGPDKGSHTTARDETGLRRLQDIETYWDSLRRDRRLPARAEVDPRSLQAALAQTFILERIAPGMARVRVAGHLLSDLLGVEMRGMPVGSLIVPESRMDFGAVLEDVFRGPAKATLRFSGDPGPTRPRLAADMILLPLTGHRGDVSRVLGGVAFHGQIGPRPRRLVLEGSFLRQVRRPEAAPLPQTRATHVPHLRLVEN
ncbi:PAS domain-containing protein [Shimia sp. SDUM112013]|uniref:PAS domain-containing protein n=1 Tax=Shimia sp. SDUM112013 TaxID=3136160 RepID=UPI0032EB4235